MLFPNAKRTNLKVSVSPISDLWNRFRMSLGHEFIGKKSKAIKRLWGAPPLYQQQPKEVTITWRFTTTTTNIMSIVVKIKYSFGYTHTRKMFLLPSPTGVPFYATNSPGFYFSTIYFSKII